MWGYFQFNILSWFVFCYQALLIPVFYLHNSIHLHYLHTTSVCVCLMLCTLNKNTDMQNVANLVPVSILKGLIYFVILQGNHWIRYTSLQYVRSYIFSKMLNYVYISAFSLELITFCNPTFHLKTKLYTYFAKNSSQRLTLNIKQYSKHLNTKQSKYPTFRSCLKLN